MDVKDYRVTVKVRNNRILQAIEAVGGEPGVKWCNSVGLPYVAINELISLRRSPLQVSGALREEAIKLCEVTNTIPSDLWSNDQIPALERNITELELSAQQVEQLIGSSDEVFNSIAIREAQKLVADSLSKLTPREESVLRMRFYEDVTLDNAAERLNITRERVRKVEQRALGKLRAITKTIPLQSALTAFESI